MSKDTLQSNIENYVLGKLPAGERERFETAMKSDLAFAEQVRLRRAEWEVEELLAEQMLRAQIRKGLAAQQMGSKDGGLPRWAWALGLSGLVVLLGFLCWPKAEEPALPATPTVVPPTTDILPTAPIASPSDSGGSRPIPPQRPPSSPEKKRPSTPDYRQLALAAYSTPEHLGGARGDAPEGDTLTMAQEAFGKKDYRRVRQLLAALPQSSTQEALALRAHAQFLSGQYAAAELDFEALLKGGIYKRDAEWFGLLSGLAQGVGRQAVFLKKLDAIRLDERHPWQGEAGRLWEKIKK